MLNGTFASAVAKLTQQQQQCVCDSPAPGPANKTIKTRAPDWTLDGCYGCCGCTDQPEIIEDVRSGRRTDDSSKHNAALMILSAAPHSLISNFNEFGFSRRLAAVAPARKQA